jgi:ankyrin repeat protein
MTTGNLSSTRSRNEPAACEIPYHSFQSPLLILSDRFRWVYCQLDTLRRQFPSSIRKTLNELPTSLDETYERTLQGIANEKTQHAHRLFQCLVAAIRPLRVEELAEIFAIEFDSDTAPNVMENWRPENPEEAILSACSTLIAVVDDDGSKIVQFSHFSVKEFLSSDRIQMSVVGDIRNFHIPMDAAHAILARACLTVLLQFDENIDKNRLASFPLAFYAAQNWFNHAKYEGVAPRVQDAMNLLFDSRKPYLAAWVWIHDVERNWIQKSINTLTHRPMRPTASALYYAALCGLCGPAEYLISTLGWNVNAKCGARGTPLHAASRKGHLDFVSLLLDNGAHMNMTNGSGIIPLRSAYQDQDQAAMWLLPKSGAAADVQHDGSSLLTHDVSLSGQIEVIRSLLQYNADVNTTDELKCTPLHWAASGGHVDVTRILLEHWADINAISDYGTPLYSASREGHIEVVRLLLERGAKVRIAAPDSETPIQVATRNGHTQIAQLLVEHDEEKNERTGADTKIYH